MRCPVLSSRVVVPGKAAKRDGESVLARNMQREVQQTRPKGRYLSTQKLQSQSNPKSRPESCQECGRLALISQGAAL
eukprot:846291-Rhodomonas_salina.1